MVALEESYPPEAVQVRNTFIHVASPSAPGEPECPPIPVSCPAADIGWIHKLWEDRSGGNCCGSGRKLGCICLSELQSI